MEKINIVITTINSPTLSVSEFSKKGQVTVVGDLKTPEDWYFPGVNYLSPKLQKKLNFSTIKLLPWNHYSRKMIGYLYSLENDANFIMDTDDDNIPYQDWDYFPLLDNEYLVTKKDLGFINIYNHFTDEYIWPRGFPIEDIQNGLKTEELTSNTLRKVRIGIWQGLVDNDPDVDAIYRMVINKKINFRKNDPIILESGTICPTNSQNTLFHRDLSPLLYLPAFVTFRFTDILRGLIAQPIMWKYGYYLGFCYSRVYQERNSHNLIKDFESEIPCYLYPKKILEISDSISNKNLSIADNLTNVYFALFKEKLVLKKELNLLESWLKDIQKLHKL